MANEQRDEEMQRAPRTGIRRFVRTFDSLEVPAYRNYFLAMFLYFGAMQMTQLARPWIAYQLSANDAGERSPFVLGITVAANFVPSLVLSPYAGALADRLSKRSILMIAAISMAFLAGVTALGLYAGFLQWWHVAIIGIFQGSVMTFITPTRRAIVADLVPDHFLMNAVALHTIELNINRTVMQAVAGISIDLIGAHWAYTMIAGMYLIGTVALFSVPRYGVGGKGRVRKGSGSVMEGIRYARTDKTIRGLLLIGIVGAVLGQPLQQLLVLFQDVLHVGATEIGFLATVWGLGSLFGSTIAASLGDFKRKGLLLIGFFSLLGFSIMVFSISSIYILSLFLMFPLGIGHSGRTTVHLATLQTYAPPDMRGRILALNAMQSGLQPLSIAAITGIAEFANPQLAFAGAGATILAYGLWELLFSRTIRDLK